MYLLFYIFYRTALQFLFKATELARSFNYYDGGLSHTWMTFYQAQLTDDGVALNEWLDISLSLFVSLSLCLFLSLFLSVSVSLSVCLCLCLFPSLSVCLSLSLSFTVSVSVYLFVVSPFCLPLFLSLYLPLPLSLFLSPSFYTSFHFIINYYKVHVSIIIIIIIRRLQGALQSFRPDSPIYYDISGLSDWSLL